MCVCVRGGGGGEGWLIRQLGWAFINFFGLEGGRLFAQIRYVHLSSCGI